MGLRILNRVLGVHWAIMVSAELKNVTAPNKPIVVKNPQFSDRLSLEPEFVNLLWSPGFDSQPGGPLLQPKAGGMDSLESIPWNRILGSLNIYKFGLRLSLTVSVHSTVL